MTETKKPRNVKKQAKKDDEKIKQIIAEQLASIENIEKKSKEIEEIEEQKRNRKKNDIQKIRKYNQEEIEKKIEDKKKLPKDEKKKIRKRVLLNMLLAAVIIIYFIFLNLGSLNIPKESFVVDLKVFSMLLVAITIIIFESAYKKNKGTVALIGVEFFVTAIITLISIYVYILHKDLYVNAINYTIIFVLLYYIIKCIVIHINGRRIYKNGISDVKELIEEE